ncbi:15136_t:CDS:2 [Gigaspora margarita]|uniref:15136_t:CDS:1 n=1 Tax=Gigaspora margarita TaxID=4874 RepID=A0ABN7W6C8_GIGMA|nr:15136_t:CDS:2 [Gigaspora margarita]
MPHQLRKQLRNHFVISFVPFGGDIQDFIKPFLEELKKLEKGFVMNLNGINYWIMGGLGVFTADLPQGNDIAGVLRHNAYRGCRSCKVPKEQLTDLSYDIYYYGRYRQITDKEFQLINEQISSNAKSRFCSQYGLRSLPGPLDLLLHDHHLHTPQDAYHAVAGKIARLLDCTCSILTAYGESNLINCWKNIEVPVQWSRLPNPITHRCSFMMSDNLRILMIFPFILNRCLTVNSIKEDYLNSTCNRLHFSCQIEVRDYIIYTWALSAKAAKEVFSITIQRSAGYFKLQAILNEELEALIKLFPDKFQNLPNLHINHNSTIIANPNLLNYSEHSEIKLGQKWNKHQIETAGFVSTSLETNNLLREIINAYSSYYSFEQALLEPRVCFYENAIYTICQSNGDYYDIRLKVGEIVEVKLFEEDDSKFGKITGIIEHLWNNGQAFIFLCFKWLENFNELDSLLECSIYYI